VIPRSILVYTSTLRRDNEIEQNLGSTMQVVRQYRTFRAIPPPSHPTTSTPLDISHADGTYVGFTENDPSNPQTWSMAYKSYVIGQISFLTLSLTFASSISSAASHGMLAEFGQSLNTIGGVATTGAFVVGIGFGAMPFAPLSECTSHLCDKSRKLICSIRSNASIYPNNPPRNSIRDRVCPSPISPSINHTPNFRRFLFSSTPLECWWIIE
jgi:hypothetical protein